MAKKAPTEKKPKPPKAPREKKPKKPKKVKNAAVDEMEGVPGEEGGKKRKPPLLLFIIAGVVLIAAAALIVIFVVIPKLSGDGDGDVSEPEPSEDPGVYYELPEQFEVGEMKVSAPVPLIAANVQAVKSVRVMYTYVDLTDAGAEAANYVSQLVSKDGLYVVDEEFVRTDAPDFTVPEGEVLLAKNLPKTETAGAAEGGSEPVDMVLTVRLSWQPGTCVIVGDQEEGQVTNPPREDRPSSGATMSMNGALDYVKSLPPSVLGLSGESMDDYKVYALEGSAMVNGMACIRMKVYSRDNPNGTNRIVGSYLLSNDGQHLYQLDEVAGKVTELKLP